MIKAAVVLLALLSTSEPTEVSKVPTGTVLSIKATVCLEKDDLNKIIDAEVKDGSGGVVFKSLGGCDALCITGAIIGEHRRFLMQNKQLFAVFEVIGLSDVSQSFWVATAIQDNGWPIPVSVSEHQKRCADKIPV